MDKDVLTQGTNARFSRADGSDALRSLARAACRMVGADSAFIAASGERHGLPPRLLAVHPESEATGLLPDAGASTPVRLGEETVGVIAVVRDDRARAFGQRELAALDDLAVVAAPLLANARNGSLEVAVAGLVAAVELRDGHAGGHGGAVLDLALDVGRALGLVGHTLRDLGYAARLHDVGKLAVEESILQKAGPLTVDEWQLIREHPVAGASVLASIPGLADAAGMVRAHHERWDGRGYPDGLAGEEIPLGGRILAVCDAYCAMVEDRPYRRSLGPAAALAELESRSGSQFDGCVATQLVRLLRR